MKKRKEISPNIAVLIYFIIIVLILIFTLSKDEYSNYITEIADLHVASLCFYVFLIVTILLYKNTYTYITYGVLRVIRLISIISSLSSFHRIIDGLYGDNKADIAFQIATEYESYTSQTMLFMFIEFVVFLILVIKLGKESPKT
ncbi:MAG: hypothetical protein LBP95_06875 [Deltaproteobacteria bacterium]|jgi:hypothetical protein|nr:hypothetical protein [Deltaproteobacteria bacterium]